MTEEEKKKLLHRENKYGLLQIGWVNYVLPYDEAEKAFSLMKDAEVFSRELVGVSYEDTIKNSDQELSLKSITETTYLEYKLRSLLLESVKEEKEE